MAALRFIIVFALGIAFALGFYYGGGAQWMGDRWSGYWATPYPPSAVVETPVPVPAPVAPYPGAPVPPPGVVPAVTPIGPPVPTAPPYPNGGPPPYANAGPGPYPDGGYRPPYDEGYGEDYRGGPGYGPPPPPEPTYTSPGAVPPVGVAPVGSGPPISLHISMGNRDYGTGCEPAYTVYNDTSRPIILTERAHYRWNGRGPKDVFILQPGERQIACAADVYRASNGYPHFDYYRQNVYYGPDAIDLPPPVNIRVKE